DAPSLKGISLFDSLSSSERKELEKKCRWHEYGERERIVEQGEARTDVFFLVSGKAHVLNFSESGRVIEYATIEEGDVFGEFSAIDGLSRSAWVMAMEVCVVASMPGSDFMHLVTNNPDVALALMRKLTGIIRLSDERMANFSLLGAEQRVCLELIRLAEADPDDPDTLVIAPIPNQTNMANVIGASRETVARVLGQLRRDSVIERTDGAIFIRNRENLEKRALF
ncbi:MAG: Crp/Fnr family transcriptional regulator, partial [Magnetovibrio sp.]|nr:Crp/Fnr family transcriptional regulator [Magnetovibrio sp.]